MDKLKLTPELTTEEQAGYSKRAEELAIRENNSQKYGVVSKVHAVVLIEPETLERIVAYLREPNYTTKVKVLDKATSGVFTAADELRQATIIEDESDPRTYREDLGSHEAMLGVTNFCLSMVKTMQNQFKKK